jgi:hypothetical protein
MQGGTINCKSLNHKTEAKSQLLLLSIYWLGKFEELNWSLMATSVKDKTVLMHESYPTHSAPWRNGKLA